VWDLYGKGKLLEAADDGLSMEFDEGQTKFLMVVGLWCCHPDPTIRPSMRQVIHILNFEAPLPNLPSKFPVPMYFGPSMHMHMCKFSNTSSGSRGQKIRCSVHVVVALQIRLCQLAKANLFYIRAKVMSS
jgi:hypothetical protein